MRKRGEICFLVRKNNFSGEQEKIMSGGGALLRCDFERFKHNQSKVMDVTDLNRIALLQEAQLELKKVADLEVGKLYQLSNIRKVKTRFGDRIIIGIEGTFSVFLPARLTDRVTSTFDNLLEAVEERRMFIKFLGGQFNLCEFIYD